jgi:hypothetical protein
VLRAQEGLGASRVLTRSARRRVAARQRAAAVDVGVRRGAAAREEGGG